MALSTNTTEMRQMDSEHHPITHMETIAHTEQQLVPQRKHSVCKDVCMGCGLCVCGICGILIIGVIIGVLISVMVDHEKIEDDPFFNPNSANSTSNASASDPYTWPWNSSFPIPGIPFVFEFGNFTLHPNVTYLSSKSIFECHIEFDEDYHLQNSVITVMRDPSNDYGAIYHNGTFLIVPQSEYQQINTPECDMSYTAFQIINIEFSLFDVMLFVRDAFFTEYITAMNVNLTHVNSTIINLKPHDIPNDFFEDLFTDIDSNMTDIQWSQWSLYEGYCIFDENITDENECDFIQNFIHLYDDKPNTFNLSYYNYPNDHQRRRMVSKTRYDHEISEDEIVTKIMDGIETARIDKKLSMEWNNAVTKYSDAEYSVNDRLSEYYFHHSKEYKYKIKNGKLTFDGCIDFNLVAYVDFAAIYDTFFTLPKFKFFKLVIGADIILDFKFGFTVFLEFGSNEFEKIYPIFSASKLIQIPIAGIPLIMRPYFEMNAEINLNFKNNEQNFEFQFNANGGFVDKPVIIQFGVEYSNKTNHEWTLFGLWPNFTKYMTTETNLDDNNCIDVEIMTKFDIAAGISLYELLFGSVHISFDVPALLQYPAICNVDEQQNVAADKCDFRPLKSKFAAELSMNVYLQFEISADFKIWDFSFKSNLNLYNKLLWNDSSCNAASQAFNLQGKYLCCDIIPTKPPTELPTTTPTKNPTECIDPTQQVPQQNCHGYTVMSHGTAYPANVCELTSVARTNLVTGELYPDRSRQYTCFENNTMSLQSWDNSDCSGDPVSSTSKGMGKPHCSYGYCPYPYVRMYQFSDQNVDKLSKCCEHQLKRTWSYMLGIKCSTPDIVQGCSGYADGGKCGILRCLVPRCKMDMDYSAGYNHVEYNCDSGDISETFYEHLPNFGCDDCDYPDCMSNGCASGEFCVLSETWPSRSAFDGVNFGNGDDICISSDCTSCICG